MSKNTERIVALLTVAGVIIALFAWLAPFSPIGPSPLSPRNTLPADTVIPTQMQSTGQSTADINATAVAERVAERQSTVIALSTQQAKLGAGVLFEDNFDDGNADGWNGKGGDWTVVLDENGNYVYQGNANSSGWAYAIPNGPLCL